jgi:hypothetical protein
VQEPPLVALERLLSKSTQKRIFVFPHSSRGIDCVIEKKSEE